LLTAFLAISSFVSAQNAATPVFISKILPPIPVVMVESDMIRVSFIDGIVDGANAFSLVFENKSLVAQTFTWTLIDAAGKSVGDSHTITLAAGEKLDYASKNENSRALIFMVSENLYPRNCTVEVVAH